MSVLKEKFMRKRYFKDQAKCYTCEACNKVSKDGYFEQSIVVAPPVLVF